ncbi:hypothetical protein CHR29_23555 [Pseudomonas monteilii]|nr:hypothetical protein CHR29_23555 [Pseudomonas monteilii]AYN98317.1 hypothetical protein D8767_04775 [Pseudomonas sp. LTGT-11-2Z]
MTTHLYRRCREVACIVNMISMLLGTLQQHGDRFTSSILENHLGYIIERCSVLLLVCMVVIIMLSYRSDSMCCHEFIDTFVQQVCYVGCKRLKKCSALGCRI